MVEGSEFVGSVNAGCNAARFASTLSGVAEAWFKLRAIFGVKMFGVCVPEFADPRFVNARSVAAGVVGADELLPDINA